MLAAGLLGGCSTVVMDPAGDVARQQSHLILWATGLMLLIIIPVMALTVLFAWRYRASNKAVEDEYDPHWDHSTGLELVIWSAPLLIIIALGAITWVSTHQLDPFRPLERIAKDKPVPAGVKPLEVQVVSLDWKWLFIYPEQGIATVNELVVPVDRPVRFRLTSSGVMNTFWVPSMAGMIYTMAGMETTLNGVLNQTGKFEGVSGNYSGAGFSGMRFWTHSVSDARFDQWVEGVRRQPRTLDRPTYVELAKPSEKVAPIGYGSVDKDLFLRVVGMCVPEGVECSHHMHGGAHGADHGSGREAGDPKGAVTRDPKSLEVSPHSTSPEYDVHGGTSGGAHDAHQNHNVTWLAPRRPAVPGGRDHALA